MSYEEMSEVVVRRCARRLDQNAGPFRATTQLIDVRLDVRPRGFIVFQRQALDLSVKQSTQRSHSSRCVLQFALQSRWEIIPRRGHETMASTLWPTRTRIYFLDVTVVTVIQIVALGVKACLQNWKSPQVTTMYMAIKCARVSISLQL